MNAKNAPRTDVLANLLRSHPETAYDYLEFRRLLAGQASAFAAERATPEDLARLRACMEAMEAAHANDDPAEEAAADINFHMAIYKATHNAVMVHIMARLFELLRQGVFFDRSDLYLRRGVRDGFLRQHQALFKAISAGDAATARGAAEAHLQSTVEALREAQKADHRRDISIRRRDGSGLVAKAGDKGKRLDK